MLNVGGFAPWVIHAPSPGSVPFEGRSTNLNSSGLIAGPQNSLRHRRVCAAVHTLSSVWRQHSSLFMMLCARVRGAGAAAGDEHAVENTASHSHCVNTPELCVCDVVGKREFLGKDWRLQQWHRENFLSVLGVSDVFGYFLPGRRYF